MTKTQLAILWGLGVLAIGVLGALGLLLTRTGRPVPADVPADVPAAVPGGPPPQADYRLPETPHSAQNLYAQAEQAALRWQPDAALVSAAASWSFASLDDFSRPIDWTFQFYSPSTTRVYVINVSATTVTLIRETLSPYSLPVIDAEQLQTDSYQAINVWLNRGGGAFLKRNAVVDVSIRLARPQGNAPVWMVVGIDESGQAIQSERLDAYESHP